MKKRKRKEENKSLSLKVFNIIFLTQADSSVCQFMEPIGYRDLTNIQSQLLNPYFNLPVPVSIYVSLVGVSFFFSSFFVFIFNMALFTRLNLLTELSVSHENTRSTLCPYR